MVSESAPQPPGRAEFERVVAWLFPRLDRSDRDRLAHELARDAFATYTRREVEWPPWLGELVRDDEEMDARLMAELEMFSDAVVQALVKPFMGSAEQAEIEAVLTRAVRASAAVLLTAVEGVWMAGRLRCNRAEALEAYVNAFHGAERVRRAHPLPPIADGPERRGRA